jgi:hypothetical protein
MPPQFQFASADPSTAPTDEEAAFARFLQEAPLILARERGLNARSLALLDAHARRMGLSSEDAAAAVRLLRPDSEAAPPPPPTNGIASAAAPSASPNARSGKPGSVPTPPPPPPEQPAEERAFEAWLVCNAKRIPDSVFRPYLERRARSIAIERFRVEPTRLDDVLDRTLSAIGMKRFTADESRRHFRAYLAQRLNQGDRIGRSDLEEFYRHGESWGFSSSETDDELFSVRRSLAHADERDRSMGARYAALAIGAVLMTGGFLAALILFPDLLDFGQRSVVEDASTATGEETAAGGGPAVVAPSVDALPEWWNAEAALAHAQLARERSGAPWVKDVRSSDPAQRSRAYGGMASELKGSATSPVVRQALERLWQELILSEPDAKAAEALRHETFELIAPEAGSPGGPQEYAISFATLQAIGRALSRFDALPERVEDWKRALAAELKLSPGRLEEPDWLSACFAAVGSLWLDRLAASDLTLAEVTERRNVMQRMLVRFVASRKETDRVEAQFVRDYLLRHGEDWETFQTSLSMLTMSTSTDAVAALIGLMEGTTDAELKEALASSLRRRYDRPASEAPDELAANLRGALGIAVDSDFERRRRLNAFRIKAEPWVVQDRFVFSTPKNALVDLEKLARLTTQSWALESELRHPIFDELAKDPEALEEVEEETAPAFAGGSSFVDIAPEKLTQLREYAAALEKARDLAPAARLDLLRRITRYAGDGSDVPYPVADGILDYAAGDFVTPQEARIVATEMAKISEWPTVTLALVDAMGVWPEAAPSDQRQQLIRAFLPGWSPAEKDWKNVAAAALLEKASVRLNEIAGGSGGASPELLELASRIAELIDMRREMLAPANASPSASIGTAYQALAQAAMKSVEAATPDSKALAEAQPLFPAVERLASGDLQRAALYQRLLIRLEAERAARETPAFGDRARRLLETLALADAESKDVMQQLLFGERTLFLLSMRGEETKK